MILEGRVWILGDNVDTDAIIPARYLSLTEPAELAGHCLENIFPEFARRVRPGDLIVAGKNLGCGSSREHAPLALKGSGISCVVAQSFARIFYRNAINIGLPILECPKTLNELLSPGETIRVNLERGEITLLPGGKRLQATPFPSFMRKIMQSGGLINYVRGRLEQQS